MSPGATATWVFLYFSIMEQGSAVKVLIDGTGEQETNHNNLICSDEAEDN